jgi:hypothetical protein
MTIARPVLKLLFLAVLVVIAAAPLSASCGPPLANCCTLKCTCSIHCGAWCHEPGGGGIITCGEWGTCQGSCSCGGPCGGVSTLFAASSASAASTDQVTPACQTSLAAELARAAERTELFAADRVLD